MRVYSAVDLAGLYTLGTVVIDYRGYRVTAQSIIPGILEREQEQSVVYGSIDFGKTVLSHPKYMDLVSVVCDILFVQAPNLFEYELFWTVQLNFLHQHNNVTFLFAKPKRNGLSTLVRSERW